MASANTSNLVTGLASNLVAPKSAFPQSGWSSPTPNMSTPLGPRYAPPPTLGTTAGPVTKQSVKVDPSGAITHTITHDTGQTTTNTGIQTPPTGSTVASGGVNTFGQPTSQAGGSVVPTGGAAGTPITPTGTQNNSQTGSTSGLLGTTPLSFGGLVGGLANFQTPASTQAQQQANQAFGQSQGFINDLTQNRLAQAEALKIAGSQPMPIGEVLGREGLLNNFYAQQQAALGAGAQAASNLFSPALSSATTGQGQQLQGLTSAAGLTQPQLTAPGQAVFNPLTGQYTSASSGGGNPSTAPAGIDQTSWDNYVQMAANGQISSVPSSITSNANLSGQLNAAAKQLNPNFSPVTSAAQGASAADLTTQASQIQANANGAEANFALLLDTARKGGVNDTTVPALNTLQNNLARGLTSSEAVTLFRNTLNTVRNQYATILGGGTATDMSRGIAQEQIPDDISLSALQALEGQLKSESQNRISGINQQISQLTSGQTSNSSKGQSLGSGAGGSVTWQDILTH